MRYEAKHAGKWVASIEEKIIASGKTFKEVKEKVKGKNPQEVCFALIPKGYMAGYAV